MLSIHLPTSPHRHFLRRSSIRLSRFALGVVALLSWVCAQAVVTVGPHGTFPTIHQGIADAINHGGDEVRVELRLCQSPTGQYVCPYVENIDVDTVVSLNVSGGWMQGFQSQFVPRQGSLVKGTGADAPIFRVVARGSAIISIQNFNFDGGNNLAGFATRGILADALNNSLILIADNSIHDVNLKTSVSTLFVPGGAGMAVQAADSAFINIAGNTIQANKSVGTDTQPTYSGGAFVSAIGGGHVDFVLNTVTNNFASNANGGHCRGGGVWAAALNSSTMELRHNTYTGNAQIFCTNGATGDAAEIDSTNTAAINVYDETWTSNNIASNPGVYEVYMQADVSSHISANNGLITHGTWGGLLAKSIASGSIVISNYTIADNSSVGISAFGGATEIWNTVLWGNGTDWDRHDDAHFLWGFLGANPLFVDAANGNYQLSAGSQAINAATNSPGDGLRPFDLLGQPRPVDTNPDMGAYEFQGNPNDEIFRNGFD